MLSEVVDVAEPDGSGGGGIKVVILQQKLGFFVRKSKFSDKI